MRLYLRADFHRNESMSQMMLKQVFDDGLGYTSAYQNPDSGGKVFVGLQSTLYFSFFEELCNC